MGTNTLAKNNNKQSAKTACKQFIANLVDKNYSQANSTLQKMVEIKLSNRIRSALAEKNNP